MDQVSGPLPNPFLIGFEIDDSPGGILEDHAVRAVENHILTFSGMAFRHLDSAHIHIHHRSRDVHDLFADRAGHPV